MIWLIVSAVILLFDSAFCFLMKKRSRSVSSRSAVEREIGNEKEGLTDNTSLARRAAGVLVRIASDFTFLLCKVVGYIPLHCVRIIFYRYVFHMSLGNNVVIYFGLETRSPWNITVGNGTIIGDKAILDARYGIAIGENVNLSTGVWIWTQQHDVNSPFFSTEGKSGGVVIQNRAWLSSRTSVLPGCEVAEGCVLAAHAVLTKSITEPFSIYGGVPARKIGERNNELVYEFKGNHRWFL